MAYVSLYRKYRPQTFTEVVGQQHVTRSLTNAIREDRLHHAYLFAGPRGTGKTSTARILAKSINCVEGPTPEPCNVCDQCVAITNGSSVDVIELDMASHGGVDDARELRDRAQFAPASARRKVYILDEVHMASTAAFNALLKLVEEPPGHVLFAMATTDPQKVLPTILSRVQRLDLRRVGAADVAGRVRDLVAREGASIDDAAVDLVVRAGDGSVRDTESVLEQVLAYGDGAVTGEDVAEVLGQTSFEHTAGAVDAAIGGDLAGAFVKVQELLDDGTDLRQFALDLVAHLRDLLVLVVAPGRDDLVDATADRRDALVAQAARMDRDGLAVALDEIATALEQMRQGPARLALELALARIATRPGAPPAGGGGQASTAATPTPEPSTTDDAPGPATTAPTSDDDTGPIEVRADPDPGEPAPTGRSDLGPVPGDAEADPVANGDGPTGDGPTDDGPTDDGPAADDFASRAGAQAARIARDGLPAVPSDRPAGPEVAMGEPASSDESADLDTIRSRWEAILELVRSDSKRSHAIFEPAQILQLRNGVLALGYGDRYRSFHASNATRAEFGEVLRAAIEQATGVSVRLDIRVDGDGPPRPRPKPMDVVPDDDGAPSPGSTAGGAPHGDGTDPDAVDHAPDPSSPGDEALTATPTPLANLDPAEAMDRAAAALVDRLGAVELSADEVS